MTKVKHGKLRNEDETVLFCCCFVCESCFITFYIYMLTLNKLKVSDRGETQGSGGDTVTKSRQLSEIGETQ